MQTNAQSALNAAALVHQRVAAGGGVSTTSSYTTREGPVKEFTASPETVLNTANKFLAWLDEKDVL